MPATKRAVVPAKAGTHTPQRILFEGLWVIFLILSQTLVVMGPGLRRDDNYTLTPSAFHSRRACASRGEPSGYSASSPTVGRIFHERAHLVPTAFSTTTATPATSPSVNAPAGAS